MAIGKKDNIVKQFIIDTGRLQLIALLPKQLVLWAEDLPQLEEQLGISYQAEEIEGFFKEIISGQAKKAKEDAENYLWHTFWLMVRKADNIAVGSADFKCLPDGNGEVEIGYGLAPAFEHQGYMTETVKAMCEWAKKQPGVKHIIAETEMDNTASQRVLQRCGFSEYRREQTIWWRR